MRGLSGKSTFGLGTLPNILIIIPLTALNFQFLSLDGLEREGDNASVMIDSSFEWYVHPALFINLT